MRVRFLLPVIFLAVVSTANAQTGIDMRNCYPSGAGLTRAMLSKYSNYVSFENTNRLNRLFEIKTGNLIVVAKDGKEWMNTVTPYMQETGNTDAVKPKFTCKKTNLEPANYNSPYRLSVYDSSNTIVQETELPYVSNYAFNERNGDLVTEAKKKHLHRPGMKPIKLPATRSLITRYAFFSPDGRYMISAEGFITDLSEKTVKENVFQNRELLYFTVHFSENSKSFTVPITSTGLQTFDAASGLLTDSVPVPAALPRFGYMNSGEGFKILLLPNGRDYIYWLYYYSGAASAGLAYYIKDGNAVPFCDPGWATESINDWKQRFAANEARIKKEAAEEAARAEYNRKNPSPAPVTNNGTVYKKKAAPVTCRYCNGTGKVNYEKLAIGKGQHYHTIDQYGTKTAGVTHGYITLKCSSCNGTGLIE